MKVRLVSCTKPIEDIPANNLLELVAYCARVSNPGNQHNNETSEKLVRYLWDNKHFSPFEMVHVTLEIETTRDISRQILRHSSFRFQEWSGRYSEMTELGSELREARLQDHKNRQNSIETEDVKLKKAWEKQQEKVLKVALKAYNWALSKGVAKEQARAVLPEGNTRTRLYMTGSMRSWLHYIMLRSGHGTQLEHIEVAKACAREIHYIFPLEDLLDIIEA